MAYAQPDIYLGSLRFQEPVTTITDLFISAVCFYAFYMLTKHRPKDKLRNYLRFYFLSMGMATTIGGLIGHGFLYVFDAKWELASGFVSVVTNIVGPDMVNVAANPWKLPGWLVSMFSIALIERAAIEYAKPLIKPNVAKTLPWINITELVIFIIITFSTLNFFFVEVHSAYGLLLVVTSLNLFVYVKTKNRPSKFMLIAVGFAAMAALVYMNEWGISKWFNHYDISHCFMTIAAAIFYKASMIIEPIKK
ncbi:MAG: hypothetical protein GVY19_04515 [Bacteroidetes bacterium]|jgi:uncharacterized membrane protein YfcA|nr:hypothetical protein [Bacteroidota bacterium]